MTQTLNDNMSIIDAANAAAQLAYQLLAPASHMRKTPNLLLSCSSMPFAAASRAMPRTLRVSAGSMMPSSHSLALAYSGRASSSYLACSACPQQTVIQRKGMLDPLSSESGYDLGFSDSMLQMVQ